MLSVCLLGACAVSDKWRQLEYWSIPSRQVSCLLDTRTSTPPLLKIETIFYTVCLKFDQELFVAVSSELLLERPHLNIEYPLKFDCSSNVSAGCSTALKRQNRVLPNTKYSQIPQANLFLFFCAMRNRPPAVYVSAFCVESNQYKISVTPFLLALSFKIFNLKVNKLAWCIHKITLLKLQVQNAENPIVDCTQKQ